MERKKSAAHDALFPLADQLRRLLPDGRCIVAVADPFTLASAAIHPLEGSIARKSVRVVLKMIVPAVEDGIVSAAHFDDP